MMDQYLTGEHLYATVAAYSDLGVHRTGTAVDAATNDWFAAELKRIGGTVTRQPFAFDRFAGTSDVTIDGEHVPSMPLYYEGVGRVTSDHPFTAGIAAMAGHLTAPEIDAAIRDAQAAGAQIAVFATTHPEGELQTPNRYPRIGSGLPVVLIPGRHTEALSTGTVRVQYAAEIVSGRSDNIVATFGDASKPPIIVATPLSGWFTCAAERGTGIAIAIALARRLAPTHPVRVVGSPGHELLQHIGLQAYLQDNAADAALIIHLGANVAIGERHSVTKEMRLAPGSSDLTARPRLARTVFVRMNPREFEPMRSPLRKADLAAVLDPPQWHGEGALWAEATTSPLMSFVGAGPMFHTPGDIPRNVTGPELLERVCDAIGSAVESWLAVAAAR